MRTIVMVIALTVLLGVLAEAERKSNDEAALT